MTTGSIRRSERIKARPLMVGVHRLPGVAAAAGGNFLDNPCSACGNHSTT